MIGLLGFVAIDVLCVSMEGILGKGIRMRSRCAMNCTAGDVNCKKRGQCCGSDGPQPGHCRADPARCPETCRTRQRAPSRSSQTWLRVTRTDCAAPALLAPTAQHREPAGVPLRLSGADLQPICPGNPHGYCAFHSEDQGMRLGALLQAKPAGKPRQTSGVLLHTLWASALAGALRLAIKEPRPCASHAVHIHRPPQISRAREFIGWARLRPITPLK
jgi:hypothetical protein